MSTPTPSAYPIDRELFNLLRAGFGRVGRLLEQGNSLEAGVLCQQINAVIAHDVLHANDRCDCTASPTKIRAVYALDEFQKASPTFVSGASVAAKVPDCDPLCWNGDACVEC